MLAHVAGEDVLREIFASGEDVHAATAAEVLGADPDEVGPAERSKAKMVNYGIAYGLSAFGLADRLQIAREEAAAYIAPLLRALPGGQAVHRRDDRAAPSARATSTTLMGRRRDDPRAALRPAPAPLARASGWRSTR